MKVRRFSLWVGLLAALYACWCGHVKVCLGQSGDVIWSKPFNLSDTPQLSTHPAIVTDGYGYVHVFWSEEVGGEARVLGDLGGYGNSIFYTRWDGMNWTPATDILLVPGEGIAEYVSVCVDSENRLHAVWAGQSDIYYSSALSFEAESAHAWSEPVLVTSEAAGTQWAADVAADAAGGIHVVYATQGNAAGVYHVVSQDDAATWETASRLSDPLDPAEESFMNVRLELDGSSHLHVVWATVEHEGYGQGIYYTRSTDAGLSWAAPNRLGYHDVGDEWVGWPYLVVDREPELHLIYIDGSNKGRLQRISEDDGNTWNEPIEIIPEMEGINGYVVPVVDRLGQMHLIINMRPNENQVVGIYYARRLGEGWSAVSPLDVSSAAAGSAHYTEAAVRLGTEIYIVYNQISPGEIWLLRGVLPDVEPLETLVTPDAAPSLPQPTIAAGSTFTTTGEIIGTATPVAQPMRVPWPMTPSSTSASSTVYAGWPGIGAALVLVVGIVVYTCARSRRVRR